MNTDNKPQPPANSPSLRKQRMKMFFQASPLFIFMSGGLILGCTSHFQGQALVREYHEAPNCTSTSSPSSSLPPCTRASMKVMGKQSYHNTKSRDDFYLTLRSVSGGTQTVSLIGHLLWDKSHIGDTVTVKSWKGKTVVVSAYGYNTITEAYPEANGFREEYCVFMCGLGLVVVGLALAKGWRQCNE